MAFLAAQPIRVRIEIKSAAAPGVYEQIHALVMGTLSQHRMAERATIMAFDVEALKAFSRDGVETSRSWMRQGPATIESSTGCWPRRRRSASTTSALPFGATTPAMLERVAARKLTAGVWTVNDAGRLDYWLGMPVAYILTDEPQLARELRDGRPGD